MKKFVLAAFLFCSVLFGANLDDILKADSKAVKMARDICMEKNLVALETMAENCYTLTKYNISEKDKFILTKRACDKGVAVYDMSCFKTANFYEKGVGTGIDYTKAQEYSEKSFDLAMSTYEKELRARQKETQRIREGGDRAVEKLKKRYKEGKYKEKLLQEEIELYRRIGEQEAKKFNNMFGSVFDNAGQIDNLLAIHYEYGIGTAKNINKALQLYKQACSFQKGWGCDDYKRLKGAR